MPGVLTIALLAQAILHKSGVGDSAAIRAFREACIEGALNLSPARGRVLEEREITDFVSMSDWGRPKARRTVVKLTDAPSSYIVVSEYKNLQRKSIARSCALVSADITKDEAATAYLEGLPDKVVAPLGWPPQWTSDHPELGYRKRLRLRSDGSIVLEVGMYPTAAAKMNAGTAKP
jgi:hypothetical protein